MQIKDDPSLNVKTKTQRRQAVIFNRLDAEKDAGRSVFPILRLFMPQADGERRNYQLKESKLADCFIDYALAIPPTHEDAVKLRNYKNPVSTRGKGKYASVSTGDFAGVLAEVLRNRAATLGPGKLWTVADANSWLDQLYAAGGRAGAKITKSVAAAATAAAAAAAASSSSSSSSSGGGGGRGGGGGWRSGGAHSDKDAQRTLFQRLAAECNATEITWIARIILGDTKVRMSHESILLWYHPDAPEAFASSGDLRSVFDDPGLRNPRSRKRYSIRLGVSFIPASAVRFVAADGDRFNWHEWDDFVLEKKLDGERMVVHKMGDEIRIFSRKQNDYSLQYGTIMKAYFQRALPTVRDAILDGEMLGWDDEVGAWLPFGQNRTAAEEQAEVKDAKHHMCYVAFDLLWVDGWAERPAVRGDLTGRPLGERRRFLQEAVHPVDHYVEVLPADRVAFGSVDERKSRVMDALARAIDDGDEGVMMKKASSVYRFGERMDTIVKVKPEYADGSTELLDLCIVGGYYGEGTRWKGQVGRAMASDAAAAAAAAAAGGQASGGGSGGRRQITNAAAADLLPLPSHFVLACPASDPDRGPDGFPRRWRALCKVGTGFSHQELDEVRVLLGQRWKPRDFYGTGTGKAKVPDWLCGWKPSKDDVPDLWIDPRDSILVETKATELVPSISFNARVHGTTMTLRFPRVSRFRLRDKPVQDADTEQRLEVLFDKYGGQLIRARTRDGDWTDSLHQKKRRRAADANGNANGAAATAALRRVAPSVLREFRPADVREVAVEVDLLDGAQVFIVSDEYSKLGLGDRYDTQDKLAALVKRLGGQPTTTHTPAVRFIVAAQDTARTKFAIKANLDVLSPHWLVDTYEGQRFPDLRPVHVLIPSQETRGRLLRIVDEFGDSMAEPVTPESLRDIIRAMEGKGKGKGTGVGAGAASATPPLPLAEALALFSPDERSALAHEQSLFRDGLLPAGIPAARVEPLAADAPGPALVAYVDQFADVVVVARGEGAGTAASAASAPTPPGGSPPLDLSPLTAVALRVRRFGGAVADRLDGRVNVVIVQDDEGGAAGGGEGGGHLAAIRARLADLARGGDGDEDGDVVVGQAGGRWGRAPSQKAATVPVVRAAWVDACIAAGALLPVQAWEVV
jgi:DNA ligase-4